MVVDIVQFRRTFVRIDKAARQADKQARNILGLDRAPKQPQRLLGPFFVVVAEATLVNMFQFSTLVNRLNVSTTLVSRLKFATLVNRLRLSTLVHVEVINFGEDIKVLSLRDQV